MDTLNVMSNINTTTSETDHMMDLYDEIPDENHGTPKVKPCTLKHNPRMQFYWRMVAGLHELGHSIARLTVYLASFKCFKSNEK